ncbi:hypothetical protein [Coxiella-like endosymbiont]|uniref:hypothetical protein n=1 Tax=Coxiella-like endosymbiont TaxID=1592897 RepID=UPI002729B146|nr:hypothetical protein [Coxiella-like endosymbiont]
MTGTQDWKEARKLFQKGAKIGDSKGLYYGLGTMLLAREVVPTECRLTQCINEVVSD